MSRNRMRVAISAAGLATLLSATVALAATQQTYTQTFTVKHPGKATGMRFTASATDPTGAAPTPTAKVVLTFPSGTKINPRALASCKNTAACSAASRVGSGTATVTLWPATEKLPVVAYNRSGGMVLIISNPLGSPVVLTPTLAGPTLSITIPSLKVGTTPIIVSALSLNINKIGSGRTAYARTPAKCPKSGAWTFAASFTYTTGTVTKLTSESACQRH